MKKLAHSDFTYCPGDKKYIQQCNNCKRYSDQYLFDESIYHYSWIKPPVLNKVCDLFVLVL